jgi:hypothetical protein
MDLVDQIIAGALDAESSERGNYFNHGRYLVTLKEIVGKKGNAGPQFIPVFHIEESQNVGETDDSGVVQLANPPGADVSYPCNMGTKEASSNARGFILAALGMPETGKNDPELQKLIADKMRQWMQPSQPLRGFQFVISTSKYINQGKKNPANRGKSMVRLSFRKVPGQTKESVLANRARLDALDAGKTQQAAQQVIAQPAPAAAFIAPPAPPAPAAPVFAAPVAPIATMPATPADPFAGLF